jgi:starch synthase
MRRLKVLMLATEAAPLVKVGGLGDVAGALPVALRKLGMDVRVMLPDIGLRLPAGYKVRRLAGAVLAWDGRAERVTVRCLIVNGGLQYLVGGRPIPLDGKVYGASMGRDLRKFVFFALAALRVAESVGFQPDVLHVHDAHPGAALHFLGSAGRLTGFWKFTAGVLTIHNLAYQFNDAEAALEAGGLAQGVDARIPVHARAGLLALGIAAADFVNTVSPTYAREIRRAEQGAGLQELVRARGARVSGILNGLDGAVWNPATDAVIAATYDVRRLARRRVNRDALRTELRLAAAPGPLFALVARLDWQKGVDLVLAVAPVLRALGAQLVVLGSGSPHIAKQLRQLARAHPRAVAVRVGFDEALARRIYAGADVVLVPSRYEPCGLTQLIGMRYGAIPLVRATGGLADTVVDVTADAARGTGFVFFKYSAAALAAAVRRACKLFAEPQVWQALQVRAMQADFSWKLPVQAYASLYARAVRILRAAAAR